MDGGVHNTFILKKKLKIKLKTPTSQPGATATKKSEEYSE